MRIISGQASGVSISVPQGDAVRPTPDRTRKALFDSLGDLSGMTVLDLCAGSGAMGLEAASRGARAVYFVEENKKHCSFISANCKRLESAGLSPLMKVFNADARRPELYLSALSPDIIFADPPYAISAEVFKTLINHELFCECAAESMIIWELPSEQYDYENFVDSGLWKERNFRKFGTVNFMFMRRR
jgi:16S rRNA (guanine(966)-N(2))-methyltransferase RsmD